VGFDLADKLLRLIWLRALRIRILPAQFSAGLQAPKSFQEIAVQQVASTIRVGRVSMAVMLLALVSCSLGCVQRRFTIRSNPPGALVYIDDYQIGTTPVSTDFTYYGTRKIRLVKDGFETLTVLQPVPTPWYEIPGIDFVSENLVPGEIRDERVLDYQLQPQVIVPTEQLMGRAEELRRGAHSFAPAPTLPPANFTPQSEPLPPLTPNNVPNSSPIGLPAPPSTNALPPPNAGPPASPYDRFNY
jgi:hypothetical protein